MLLNMVKETLKDDGTPLNLIQIKCKGKAGYGIRRRPEAMQRR